MKKIFLFLLIVFSLTAYSTTKTSVVANGNWNTPSTWSPAIVPAAGDIVIINTNVTINVTTKKLAGLTINSGFTLTNSGYTLLVSNTTTSNFTNNGTYTDNASSTLTETGNLTNNGTITNAGTIGITGNLSNSTGTFTNTGKVTVSSVFTNNATFNNNSAGTLTLSGNLANNGGTFTNAGKLTGVTLSNSALFNNNATTNTLTLTGSITNSSGTFTNAGKLSATALSNSATFSNSSAGTLTLSSSLTNTSGTFTNAGTITTTGTFTNSASYSNSTGSTLTLTGNLTNNGTYTNLGTSALTGSLTNSTTFTNNLGIITLTGNFTNNGTYTDNSGSITFDGTAAQTITNKASFYDVTIDATGPITTNDSIWAKDALTLTKGTLNVTNGILVLESNATYNGRVVSVGTGNITGTFLAQKWVSRCNALWSEYGSCMGQAINTTNLYTTGFTGCPYYPSYSWVNMYTYLESATGSYTVGYTAPTSTSEVLGRGVGFIYWYENYTSGPDFPKAITMQGTLNFQTAFTFGISLTNNSAAANIGWNLVSNPFPGTIDWGATTGWTKTSMNNAEYMWNTCNSVYAAYVSGVATNGGSRYIPEGQGFFVQAKGQWIFGIDFDATPALKATSAVIVNNTTQNLLTPSNPDSVNYVLKVDLGADEIAIRLDSAATNQNDSLLDAAELFTDSTRLYSYVYSDTSDIYAINSVKDTDQVIPVKIRKSGTLNFSGVNTFQGQYTIYLKDLLNGSYQQITNGFEYPYTDTTTSTFQTRFEIHFSKIITTGIKEIAKNNAAFINYDENNIYVNFNFANPQATQIIIYNLLGQELQRVDGTFYQEKNYAMSRPNVPVIVELLNSNTKVVRKVF